MRMKINVLLLICFLGTSSIIMQNWEYLNDYLAPRIYLKNQMSRPTYCNDEAENIVKKTQSDHSLFFDYANDSWNQEVSYHIKKNIEDLSFVYPQLEGDNPQIPRVNEIIKKEAEVAFAYVVNNREFDDRIQDYIIEYNSEDFISIVFYRKYSYSLKERFRGIKHGSFYTVNIDLKQGKIVELDDILENKKEVLGQFKRLTMEGVDYEISNKEIEDKVSDLLELHFNKNNFDVCMYFRKGKIGFSSTDHGEGYGSEYAYEFPFEPFKQYLKKEISYKKYMGDYIQFDGIYMDYGYSKLRTYFTNHPPIWYKRSEKEKEVVSYKSKEGEYDISYPQIPGKTEANQTIKKKAMEMVPKVKDTHGKPVILRYQVEYKDEDIINILFQTFQFDATRAKKEGETMGEIDWDSFDWKDSEYVEGNQFSDFSVSLKTGEEIQWKEAIDSEDREFQNLLLEIELYRTRGDYREGDKLQTMERWSKIQEVHYQKDKLIFWNLTYSIMDGGENTYSYVIPYSEIKGYLKADFKEKIGL